METNKIKINKKILFTIVLLLGLTLTLNTGFVSASNNSSINQSTSNHNSINTNNTTSNQVKSAGNITSHAEGANTTTSSSDSNTTYNSSTKTIKVLIYDGIYSIADCVTGIETALKTANSKHLVPGYNFTYATSTVINTAKLAPYDVLAMPGGDAGSAYINSSSINGTAIKNFVASGKGYLGICAGAYSGAYYVNYMYYGWGVAPHVICEHPYHEGNLTVQITSAGQQLFGYGGVITMVHNNGPAMYASGGSIVTFATYADNIIGYKGYGAIVGDYYGKGRTVLSGPHPELDPQYPDILAKLILWAANPTKANSITVNQVASAASNVKTFYEANKRLPNYITISNQQVTMPQYLYLLAKSTVQANSGSTTPITLSNVDASPASSGKFKTGNIQKSEYLSIAQSLITFITANGRTPNYVTTSLGKMSFNSAVYLLSKVMNFYQTNNRLPKYVSMTP